MTKLNHGDLKGFTLYCFNEDEPEIDESLDEYYEDDEDIDTEEELYHADGYSVDDDDEDDEDE